MKRYIIDGNNLIGKIKSIKNLQKKDKQASREKLAFVLDRFFQQKKYKATLHFDGHPNLPIKVSKIKIIYSENETADDKIKYQIEQTRNRKLLSVVTSDGNLREFARVCSCEVISSEDFGKEIMKSKNQDEEKAIIDSLQKDIDEFKKLFDAE